LYHNECLWSGPEQPCAFGVHYGPLNAKMAPQSLNLVDLHQKFYKLPWLACGRYKLICQSVEMTLYTPQEFPEEMLWTYSLDDIERILKLKSVSKYDHFSRRYSDTKVEKWAILLLKMEENGRFLSPDIFARNCSILKQTSVLRLSQCRLLNKCIKLPIANC
jgi:hypothetical protein